MVSSAASETPSKAPRSIYVHIPFCRRVCPYCDFAVTTPARSSLSAREFTELLRLEIAHAPEGIRPRTLYFGGGTPSSLEIDCLESILRAMRERFDLSRLIEATIEVNPEDSSSTLALELARLGFNRISLGVQSLEPGSLRMLGRRHTPEDVRQAVRHFRDAGMTNLSFDLIIGHPRQTADQLRRDLEGCIALRPEHVSCYAMTYESGTPYARARARGGLGELRDDTEAEYLRFTRDFLAASGFASYEVSNFSLPGRRSLHNLGYWRRTPYWGFGPSAASFDGAVRWQNPRDLAGWRRTVLESLPSPQVERLEPDQQLLEVFMLGLRRPSGVRWSRLPQALARALPDDFEDRLATLVADGLLVRRGASIRPTARGIELADSITLELLRDHEPDRRQP